MLDKKNNKEINKEDKNREKKLISIPKRRFKSRIFIFIFSVIGVVSAVLIFFSKDVIFPSHKKNEIPPKTSLESFKLEEKYIINYDVFDSEKETSFWLVKNYLKTQIENELKRISAYLFNFEIILFGKDENNENSNNSNIKLKNTKVSFEWLEITELSFKYQLKEQSQTKNDIIIFEDKIQNFTYKKGVKMFM